MMILVGLDITHKSIAFILITSLSHRVPSMRILYLIQTTSPNLIQTTSPELIQTTIYSLATNHETLQCKHRHLNHMRIYIGLVTNLKSQLDTNHNSGEWLMMIYNQQVARASKVSLRNEATFGCLTKKIFL